MASRTFTVDYDDTFNATLLQAELTQDEGRILRAYHDSLGIISIGTGRNLEDPGLRDAECDFLWLNDVAACCAVMDHNIPWWRQLKPNEQRCFINLCFMGWAKFAGFQHFMAAMQDLLRARTNGDTAAAAQAMRSAVAELQNSKWWSQVKTRGPRVVQRLTGASAGASSPSV
jgi:lysozyme